MRQSPIIITEPCRVPLWWTLLRDTALLVVGLAGIIYEHRTPGDARPLIVITDLVLIGLIPLGHLITALPRPTVHVGIDRPPAPEPEPVHPPPAGAFDPRTEGPG